MKQKFTLELEWKDGSNAFADIQVEGKDHEIAGILLWICRGSLMASNAEKSTMWNDQGFEFCSYLK